MSKIQLTTELADTIRELRIQNKIASKDVTDALGRSPSYISKIEKGQIKSISEEEFEKLLEIIIPECTNTQERVGKIVQYQMKKDSHEDLERKVWFQNLDTVYRLIPVPKKLINEIKGILEQENISVEQLVKRINTNEEMLKEERDDESIPYNQWVESKSPDCKMVIKMLLNQEVVENILNGQKQTCNYVTMQAIVHYLFKMKMYDSEHEFNDNEIRLVQKEWEKLLDEHKFYTLSRKEWLLSNAHSKKEANNILNEFDIENQETIKQMLEYMKLQSDMNVVFTNTILKQFVSNLEWDSMFMLMVLGLKFDLIQECSHTNKVQILRDINKIITKYIEMPKEERMLDSYGDFN